MFRSMLLAGLVLCSLPFALRADDEEAKQAAKDAAKNGSPEVVIRCRRSDAKPCCGAACTVNFTKELGVPLDYLSGIGHRISQARKAPDPVDLAMAAQNLSVAEQLAGKTASIKSQDVMKEAVELAKLRAISSELAAVALVVADEATKNSLNQQATAAKQDEADRAAAIKEGSAARSLVGYLTVDNHTAECVRIMVNGKYYGEVHTGQRGQFYVHDHCPTLTLQAYCEDDNELVSQSVDYGRRTSLYWHID